MTVAVCRPSNLRLLRPARSARSPRRRGAPLIALAAALTAALTLGGCARSPATAPVAAADVEGAEATVRAALAEGRIRGLALAYIEDGQIRTVRSYGQRNAAGQPLTTSTVMYGASLTKAVFGYTVMQLVDEGRLTLDTPIGQLLDRPLPDYPPDRRYGPWRDLKDDPRWQALTPRILLSHRSGFANFAFLEPDGKLRFHFDPGRQFGYSGEGLILLQFALEQGTARLDLGQEMNRRVFERLRMRNTSMTWRADFAADLADGVDAQGRWRPHDERSRVRAAGSMDTTIDDFARFAAGYVRGDGLTPRGRAELVRAQQPITTASQFPTLQPELPPAQRRAGLGAGLGVVVFDGPQGPGFFKGGHDDQTGNMWVCVERRRACAVLLSNDVRAEALYPRLVRQLLGETGLPWDWEYGPNGPGGPDGGWGTKTP